MRAKVGKVGKGMGKEMVGERRKVKGKGEREMERRNNKGEIETPSEQRRLVSSGMLEESSQKCQPGDLSEGSVVLQAFPTMSDILTTGARTPLSQTLAGRPGSQCGGRSSQQRNVRTLRILF